jgi:ketosteroid isomerase-like protein
VFKLREGKVTSFQQYVDTARMQDVMGARLETPQAVQA